MGFIELRLNKEYSENKFESLANNYLAAASLV